MDDLHCRRPGGRRHGGGDAYPRAEELLAFSLPRLRGYLAHYGPHGEFNESVGYAGSTLYPVTYFMAYRYHTHGRDNIVGRPPFTDFCRWYLYFTLPQGKIVNFGDSHTGAPPMVSIFPAVAQAGRDGVLQWYYRQHCAQTPRSMPYLELLWLDESLEPVSPEGVLPLGHAFPAHSGNIISRTDWNPRSTACVVYAKAGHGREGHGHHDAGQVCIDGYGERLIVDLGSPTPAYPPDFFGKNRFRYYAAGVHGHNVLAFGGQRVAHGASRGTPAVVFCSPASSTHAAPFWSAAA